tara:strand:+ start:147 stop:383 length:237 start_codon:yes stop_codon:yes gene_type:complete
MGKVRSYTRQSKNGKTVKVKSHTRGTGGMPGLARRAARTKVRSANAFASNRFSSKGSSSNEVDKAIRVDNLKNLLGIK